MVRDINIDIWLGTFILGGSSLASHIPYLMAVQLTIELESQQSASERKLNLV